MAKKINLRPMDDRVVVEPVEAEETTAGGIVLPDSAKEKPQRGTIVAVGPGKLLDSGNRGELSVSVGDTVIYGKYGGSDIEVDGRDMKILRESDILAKVLQAFSGLSHRGRAIRPRPPDPKYWIQSTGPFFPTY